MINVSFYIAESLKSSRMSIVKIISTLQLIPINNFEDIIKLSSAAIKVLASLPLLCIFSVLARLLGACTLFCFGTLLC